ncbi:MAG TPA: hypothetical protein PKK18_04880 [Chitinophagales bacterium]|nr:hypothetical protein [Chitinophagales bacterium]TXH21535.1 MAG: hypothetical protein E6Q95_03545 [Chitinophagaceae bacterium]HMV14325.1 hypothetical protein [Chitinophagales bacterium]HMX59721.1 hypothetical protein [Chitinophagales bacterium]HMZ33092.1 hypothetical protein [Chitinophagales bacterium]
MGKTKIEFSFYGRTAEDNILLADYLISGHAIGHKYIYTDDWNANEIREFGSISLESPADYFEFNVSVVYKKNKNLTSNVVVVKVDKKIYANPSKRTINITFKDYIGKSDPSFKAGKTIIIDAGSPK